MLKSYLSRPYHNLDHIASCLKCAQWASSMAVFREIRWDEVIYALIYHDIFYEAGRDGNEELSADWACRQTTLFAGHYDLGLVQKLIMATRHTGELLQLLEEKLVVDIDLHGLASSYDTFDDVTNRVRLEFSRYTFEEWKTGRAKFYRTMLARERIFYTNLFFLKYERQARFNLRRGLQELGQTL